jgi:hypothetical protein
MSKYQQLHDALKVVAADIASGCAQENIPHFDLSINISCRSDSGEYVLEYQLSEDNYLPKTRGRHLSEVVVEFVRRWKRDAVEHCKLLTFNSTED